MPTKLEADAVRSQRAAACRTRTDLATAALVSAALRRDGSDALETVDDPDRFCVERGFARHDSAPAPGSTCPDAPWANVS